VANFRELEGIDRFVRAILPLPDVRRRVLSVLVERTPTERRAEALRAELRRLRPEVTVPRLTEADAAALVRAFDRLHERNPDLAREFSRDELPRIPAPFDDVVMVS
jgi:hypothetical protein